MKRHFLPGYYDPHGVARATTCCTGECEQGRHCPLIVDRICRGAVPLKPVRQRPVFGAQWAPGQVMWVQPAIERIGVPRWRRVCRTFRDFLAVLLQPRWTP